jgi:biopolymer transport protein TolQ
MTLPLFSPLLASGLDFAIDQCTPSGMVICIILGAMSCLSWGAMMSKYSLLGRARAANNEFLHVFRSTAHPLAIFQSHERFEFASLYHIYLAASRELAFHLVGVDEPDKTFVARMQGAGRISPTQMAGVQNAMEQAVAEAALKLEAKMSVVAMALSGAPFLGLLGTVWGVMDSFAELAGMQGNIGIQVMAPGVCAALLTTVVGLLVAIPSMFGYNFLVNAIRAMVVRLDNFAGELSGIFDRHYVDHRHGYEELPSLGALGSPNLPAFSNGVGSGPLPQTMRAASGHSLH